jgi:hypothetical protein
MNQSSDRPDRRLAPTEALNPVSLLVPPPTPMWRMAIGSVSWLLATVDSRRERALHGEFSGHRNWNYSATSSVLQSDICFGVTSSNELGNGTSDFPSSRTPVLPWTVHFTAGRLPIVRPNGPLSGVRRWLALTPLRQRLIGTSTKRSRSGAMVGEPRRTES